MDTQACCFLVVGIDKPVKTRIENLPFDFIPYENSTALRQSKRCKPAVSEQR